MNKEKVINLSYWLFAVLLLVIIYFGIATPFLTVLFSTFALRKLMFYRKKWLAVLLFAILVCGIFSGFAYFLKSTVKTLPEVLDKSIPIAMDYAKQKNFDLPFNDIESLRVYAVSGVKQQLAGIAKFASIATKEFVFLLIGLVVAISIFLNSKIDLDQGKHAIQDNIYSVLTNQLATRFSTLFHSFSTVMGAQIKISAINTIFTGIFLFGLNLLSPYKFPHTDLVIVITFLCGLLPIVGNLMSNTIICCIAMTESPNLTIACLAFLVALHKAEYFLNSKIVGEQIRNPMWLTLLALLVGERVMGIPGMILAPVLLHYLKTEGLQITVKPGKTPA